MIENETNKNLIYGRNAVIELLKTGHSIDKIFVKSGEREGSLKLITAEAKRLGIPVVETGKSKLDELSSGALHQGVIASAAEKDYVDIDYILNQALEKNQKPFIVIADCIEDPFNLGAIIRTAECAGAHGLIIPKRRATGTNGIVAKTSAGAIEYLPIARVPNLANTVDELKKKGLWIYAAESGGTNYYDCDMNSPAAIILGGEDSGVSRLLRDKSDFIVSIPLYGKISSLNVSAAAAVIFNEMARQQRKH
ncbi:MAG: 23S rRNA (guanosine(2251)-2'-O)-methyltransferase RlmB [Eubacteriales bacterium]